MAESLTEAGLKNEDGFTWMQAREISVAGITVQALRVFHLRWRVGLGAALSYRSLAGLHALLAVVSVWHSSVLEPTR